ncbi:Gti1/Pac2 family-domain-containing protein [Mycena polygramma]|nr:Gti1/Pac2 family-domain-containing protein [Mycena polygramma]
MLHVFYTPGSALINHARAHSRSVSSPSMHNSSASRHVTHPALHIRNATDALVVLEAVRRSVLPLITVRLSGSDRDQLDAGNIFVWQESAGLDSMDDGGLVRWTDGRRWSQSKVCAECLFYQEKVEVTEAEREAKAMRRAQRICNPGANIPPPRRNHRPSKSGGLTKQTFSFLVRLPGTCDTRKWHLVAYTVWQDRARLPVIEDYPALRTIEVPVGVFARNKASDIVPMHHSAHSTAEQRYGSSGDMRLTERPGPFRTVLPNTFQDPLPALGSKLPSFNPGRDEGADLVLPPISWLQPPSRNSPVRAFSEVPVYFRDPLAQEDRRILDSFRLSL